MCQHLLPKQRWLPENSYTHLVVSLRNLDEMISYTATDVAVFNTVMSVETGLNLYACRVTVLSRLKSRHDPAR